ncbi:MAG: cell wall hydrolase [Sphingobium sp.]
MRPVIPRPARAAALPANGWRRGLPLLLILLACALAVAAMAGLAHDRGHGAPIRLPIRLIVGIGGTGPDGPALPPPPRIPPVRTFIPLAGEPPMPVTPAIDAARMANARAPFIPGKPVLAAPFLLPPTGALDRARAVDCLAAAAYYEAGRGEPDQRAVMQVVLNRLRHPAFPRTVCGVVFQQSEQAMGCQFTFACDGSMARRQPSPEAWRQARGLAEEALSGRTEPAVGYATHYHTDWVFPAWSPQMDKIAAVHTHLFFRWRGARGNAAAFLARYAGGEMAVAKMAALSPAHAVLPLTAPMAGPMAGIAIPESAPASPAIPVRQPGFAGPVAERLPDMSGAPDSDVFLVLLETGTGADGFLPQARRLCAGHGYCKVIGWTDPRGKADRMPLPGSAIDAIAFTFIRASADGAEQARWDCGAFPRSDPAQCLRR